MDPSTYLEAERWKVYIDVPLKNLTLSLEKTPGNACEAKFEALAGDVFRVVVVDLKPSRIRGPRMIAQVCVFLDGQDIGAMCSDDEQYPDGSAVVQTASTTEYVFDRVVDDQGTVRKLDFRATELTDEEHAAQGAFFEARIGAIAVLIKYGYRVATEPEEWQGPVATPRYRTDCEAAKETAVSCGLGAEIEGIGPVAMTCTNRFARLAGKPIITFMLRYSAAALPPPIHPIDEIVIDDTPEPEQDEEEKPKPSPSDLAELDAKQAKADAARAEADKNMASANAAAAAAVRAQEEADEFRAGLRRGTSKRPRSEQHDVDIKVKVETDGRRERSRSRRVAGVGAAKRKALEVIVLD